MQGQIEKIEKSVYSVVLSVFSKGYPSQQGAGAKFVVARQLVALKWVVVFRNSFFLLLSDACF